MVDKSEKVRWLVRLGYLARGLVYILIGYLAFEARDTGKAEEGASGVFALLQDVPLGTALLYPVAIGLAGYAIFRFSSAILDSENHGTDNEGIAHRIGHFGSGLAHLFLAYAAFQFAQGSRQVAAGGDAAQQAAGLILSFELGSFILGLIGAGFLIAGAMQAKKAATASFMQRVSSLAPTFTCWLGRVGHAARALVFAVIGWSLLQSAWFDNSSQVKSLGSAIGALSDHATVHTFVALGLLVFGIFSVILSRYRIVPDIDPG